MRDASYRDHVARLLSANDADIRATLDLAQHVGDATLARAAAAVADTRGMTSLVRQYIGVDMPKLDTFIKRNALPTTTTLTALAKALRPNLAEDELAPSARVMQRRRDKERQRESRRFALRRR